MTVHLGVLDNIRHEASAVRGDHIQSALSNVSSSTYRAIERAVDFVASGWLTILPLAQYHFDLSPQQFCNALSFCDGCGAALPCHMLWIVRGEGWILDIIMKLVMLWGTWLVWHMRM